MSLSLFMTSLTQMVKTLQILQKICRAFSNGLLILSRFLQHWQITLLNIIFLSLLLLLERSSNLQVGTSCSLRSMETDT